MTETNALLPDAMPDFDELAELARTDPASFEARREALLEQCVLSAPPAMRRRLRGLVFELNMARESAASPLASCLDASGRMWQSFDTLRMQLNAAVRPEALSEDEIASLTPERFDADVLPFKAAVASADS